MSNMHNTFSRKFRDVGRLPDHRTEVPRENVTGEEFRIVSPNWKKAEQSVPKNAEAGPGEIAISLTNQLGPRGNAQLTSAVEQVIDTKKILTHRRRSKVKLSFKGQRDKTSARRIDQ